MEGAVTEHAARGAALLDGEQPGWAERVDLSTFDLGKPCACVLAQVYGSYWGGRRALGMIGGYAATAETWTHGFTLRPIGIRPGAWQALQEAWVAEILVRREVRT